MIGIELLLIAAVGSGQEPASARQEPPRLEAPAPVERETTLDCAAARRIVEAKPCLAPEGCQAYELWTESFGPPGSRSLDRRGYRFRGDLRRAPPTLVCPAAAAGVGPGRLSPSETEPGR